MAAAVTASRDPAPVAAVGAAGDHAQWVIPKPPAPLLPAAIGLMFGIAADNAVHLNIAVYLIPALAAAIVLLRRADRLRSLTAALLIGLAAAGLGALRHAWADRTLPQDHIGRIATETPQLVNIEGRVLERPRITRDDIAVYRRPYRTQFNLEARSIQGEAGPFSASGIVSVSVRDAVLDLSAGDNIRITGWLARPGGPRNPGAFDWRLHLRRQGIHARLACDHLESVRVVQATQGRGILEQMSRFRAYFRGRLLEGAFDEADESGGIVSAVVLGERSAVGRAMNDVFRRTGCTHFLAASGMNVAWLGLLVVGAAWLLGLHYRLSAILTAAVLIAYAALAEPEPSILRAVIIGLLACVGVYFRGGVNSLNWLACSAVLLLLLDPYNLFRPAFQLSFIAVAAVVHLSPRIIETARTLHFEWRMRGQPSIAAGLPLSTSRATTPPVESSPTRIAANWLLQTIGLGMAVSIAAWLAAAPIAAYTFDQFTPLGWLWTQLLIIPAFLATLIGFAKLIIDLFFPSASVVTGPMLAATTEWFTSWAAAFSRTPMTIVSGNSPSPAWVIATYAYLIVWIWRPGWFRRRSIAIALALALIAWWCIPARWQRVERGSLLVWSLAVGDGLATLIELPDGRALIYDFGTRSGLDASRVAQDVLRDRGITRIAAIIVSHTDVDHLSAMATLCDAARVERVLISDHFAANAIGHLPSSRLLQTLEEKQIVVENLPAPSALEGFGDVEVILLWPPPRSSQGFTNANDTSVVLRLAFYGQSILLTGDIGEDAMAALLKRGNLKADILALPHHGAVVSNTRTFIQAVNPDTVIRSTGQRRDLTTNGIESICQPARYLSTADVGCVKATLSPTGVSVEAPFTP